MTPAEAKKVLLLHRPGSANAADAEISAALHLVEQDAELRAWFQQHCASQAAMQRKFREIPVPPSLKARILSAPRIVRPTFWRRRAAWFAAAAAIALLLGVGSQLLQPRKPDRFADYRARMVRAALREYRMDILTNDMQQVRRYMATHGVPSDYELPPGLSRLRLTGGGALKWRSNPVAMVCFNRGDDQMLFLFVMNSSAVKDTPPAAPLPAKVNKLQTVSWTSAGKTYLLAGPEEADFATKYF